MNTSTLALGDRSVEVRLPHAVLLDRTQPHPGVVDLPAAAASAALATPAGARSVCLVVPDRTRDARLAEVLPPLLEALARRGLDVARPDCVFASGTHAPMTADEMARALGPVAKRVRALSHDCDATTLVTLGGRTRVHPAVASADVIVVVGALSWHYLAGFGGGRKMILPGVADRATATEIHSACLTSSPPGRAPAAAMGVLDDNPLHLAIVERLRPLLPRLTGVSVVVEDGRVIDAEGGPLLEHHRQLAGRFAERRTLVCDRVYDGVVLCSGGSPYDGDLVQAHKALFAIAPVMREGGRVAWLADLGRGLGHARMREWMTTRTREEQLEALLDQFIIGEQTAWSLRSLVARYDVGLVSSLDDEEVRALGMTPLTLSSLEAFVGAGGPDVAVAPRGAAYRYVRGSAPR